MACYNPGATGTRGRGEEMANRRGAIQLDKRPWVAGAVGLAMLALTGGVVSAQRPMPPMPAEHQWESAPTHEQMHQMMDAMHGEGASERMHQAMGGDAEQMMDQCVAMMNMMSAMRGMMGEDAMPDMMHERSTSDMTRRMMGR